VAQAASAPPAFSASAGPANSPNDGAGCAYTFKVQTITLSERDNGRRFCVVQGTQLEIFLKGTAAAPWSHPMSDPAVLRPVPHGMALVVGMSAGFFVADRLGHAHVTASRGSSQFEIYVSVLVS
jgi:hypothetical protein